MYPKDRGEVVEVSFFELKMVLEIVDAQSQRLIMNTGHTLRRRNFLEKIHLYSLLHLQEVLKFWDLKSY
jgi:hypothetical protein